MGSQGVQAKFAPRGANIDASQCKGIKHLQSKYDNK
jgi:hypothetical protein